MKYKTGVCSECLNGMEVPLIARLCQYHYRKHRHEVNASKPKKLKVKAKIKPMSAKRQKESKEYSKLRIEFLTENKECKAKLKGCTYEATQVHHKKGRGIYYLDQSTWLPICHECHEYITEFSNEAIELGLSESRLKSA